MMAMMASFNALLLMSISCDHPITPAHSQDPGRANAEKRTSVLEIELGEDRVLVFHEVGCPDCEIVKEELLPRFLEVYGLTGIDVLHLDIANPDHVRRLLALERQLGTECEKLAPVVVHGRDVYCGVEALARAIEEAGQ